MVSPRCLVIFIILLSLHSDLGKLQPLEYHAVGSNVTLQTGHGGSKPTSVDWKHGPDIAVKWVEQELEAYRNFKDRISLNLTNGDLTLIGVTESESGEYTVALSGKDSDTKHFIKVIHPVPVPTVTVTCGPEDQLRDRPCLCTCAGNTSQSEPVSYEWSLPNAASTKTINVTMSLNGTSDQLFCTMKNPVSNATSLPISMAPPSPPAESTDYIVILTVISAILVLLFAAIGIHRHNRGVWIWIKEIWAKRRDERNGSSKYESPKPLLDNNENNVATRHDESVV